MATVDRKQLDNQPNPKLCCKLLTYQKLKQISHALIKRGLNASLHNSSYQARQNLVIDS